MTDLHTHILPGMDDGAPDVSASLRMLRLEGEQAVDTVALTPHFYRDRERPEHFFSRRELAFDKLCRAIEHLPEEERKQLPALTLGAEVAWVPGLAEWPELEGFCYDGTRFLLVELPFFPWNGQIIGELYGLMERTGLIPVIAHLERYFRLQKQGVLDELLSMGLPVQFSAEALLHFSTRGRALRMLRDYPGSLLISDCHDDRGRPPNILEAVEVLRRKEGDRLIARLDRRSDELLTRQGERSTRRQKSLPDDGRS